jgi:hypothetical protein
MKKATGVPFSLWEKVAPQGVEGRPSFDGLWRQMRVFGVTLGPMTKTLIPDPSPDSPSRDGRLPGRPLGRGECAHA